jgi:hypothetical protein
MATLIVRAYNVHFGDAILVIVPDRDADTGKSTRRHILIDVGNVLAGDGGDDAVFKPAIDDIIDELNGRPLDLYVMTHEHLDHIQGLPHVSRKVYPDGELESKLSADFAWLTASAAPDYYDRFPDARRKLEARLAMYEAIRRHVAITGAPVPEHVRAMLANNNPRSTADCVDYLRDFARNTTYVHRTADLEGTHPFREARLSIWAPEEDTSDYYGPFRPVSLEGGGEPADRVADAGPIPPPGVDAGAFYGLARMRSQGLYDNLLAIDRAANDSSIVFCLEWRGWRLLFPGDAELRSWRTMHREGVLAPVHFLKVAHHGSHNGTPDDDIFEAILPERKPDRRGRHALISSWPDTYGGIPHGPTNARLAERCKLRSMVDDPTVPYLEVKLRG